MNYSVGEEEENLEKSKYKGILIEFKHYEKAYFENAAKNYNFNLNYNDSIFIINIPLMIFNLKDSLFYNKKQCFLSKIFTENEVANKNFWMKSALKTSEKSKSYEKVKVKLGRTFSSGLKLLPIEFLFSRLLINSLNYFQTSKQSLQDVNQSFFKDKCKYINITFNYYYRFSFN